MAIFRKEILTTLLCIEKPLFELIKLQIKILLIQLYYPFIIIYS